MTTQRLSRVAVVLTAVGALVLSAIAIIVWIEMPSIGEVATRAPKLRTPELLAPLPPALAQNARPMAEGGPTDIQASPNRSTVPTPLPVDPVLSYLTNRFGNGAASNINVCGNLNQLPMPPIRDARSMGQALTEVATGQSLTNPYVESILPPIAYIDTLPAVQRLIGQYQTAQAAGDTSAFNGPDFRSALALANSEILANQATLQRIGQHSYHLYILTRALSLNPSLIGTPETMDLCNRLQSELRSNAQVDQNAEKQEMLRFLAYAEISPAQVGYDPSNLGEIGISTVGSQVVVRYPWMMRTMNAEIGTITPIRQAGQSQP